MDQVLLALMDPTLQKYRLSFNLLLFITAPILKKLGAVIFNFKILMKPLLTILFLILLVPAISHGQTTTNACKDSSIDAGYYLNNSSLGIGKFITTKDDGKLLITISGFTSITNTYSITRLSSTGTINWNRSIKPANTNEVIEIQNLLELRNGGFIIGGARNFPDYSAPTYFFLMRFDDNGNLLWQHKYKNNYNPPADNVGTAFATLNEGENGETIGIINYNDQGVQSITRFDANGNVIWSNGYNIGNLNSLLPDYTNIYDGSNINLWGIAAPGPDCLGDVFNQGLASIQVNYATGLVVNYKSFCKLSPTMPKLYLSETEGNSFLKKLANKNTVNILTSNTGTLLINIFDSNLNCIKSKLYTPPDMHSITYTQQSYYSYDVSDNGEVAFCVQIEYSHPFRTYLPYQPLILLDANLNIKQEYIIHAPDLPYNSGPFPLKFTPSGKIAFLAVDEHLHGGNSPGEFNGKAESTQYAGTDIVCRPERDYFVSGKADKTRWLFSLANLTKVSTALRYHYPFNWRTTV